MKASLILALGTLLFSAGSPRADCVDDINVVNSQYNAELDWLKSHPHTDEIDSPTARINAQKILRAWIRARNLALKEAAMMPGCGILENPRAEIAKMQKAAADASNGIKDVEALLAILDNRIKPGDGSGRPNPTRPSNNDSTAANICIDATPKRNGKYWDYKVKNSCGKPVRFDYDDCELSGMKTVCAAKSDSVGANDSTMLRSNYMNPPNVRNVR